MLLAPFATTALLHVATCVRETSGVCAGEMLLSFPGGQNHRGQEGMVSVPGKRSRPRLVNTSIQPINATREEILHSVNIYLINCDGKAYFAARLWITWHLNTGDGT